MKNRLFLSTVVALCAACSDGELPDVTPNLPPRPGTFNPITIFTDRSCTALRDEVTKELIESTCDDKIYRSIALQLLDGTYPAEFRIMDIEPLPDPSLDAARNKTAKYGIMDNPTGISLSSGDTLRVFVSGLPAAGAATLKIQSMSTENLRGYDQGPAAFSLANGENIILAGALSNGKGLAYIRYYYTDEGNKPTNMKVNIHGGEVNGYFDLRKHTAADWQRLISAAVNPYFDIVGKYAASTAPTAWYRKNTGNRGKDLVDAFDAIVYLEWKFMGLLDLPHGFGGHHRTRAYFHQEVMGPGVGAYATDYRTAYPGEYLTKPDVIVGGEIWVFGHEHGHVNQTRPGFRWAGMVEVTNNLEAMYLRTHVHELVPTSTNTPINTNLQTVPDGGYVNTYERAFNWFFGHGRPLATPTPHNRNDNNAHLFHQLVPFWQLYLYLDNILGKKGTHGAAFYEDIYEHYRKNDPTVSSRADGQHQLYFVELVCKTARLDLTDFFRKTGFLQPYSTGNFLVSQAMIDATINAIKTYPAPTQAMEYITDANATIFKNKLPLQTGNGAEVNAAGRFISPPDGWTNAVAFEVREGNEEGDIKCVFTTDNGITAQTFNGNGFTFDIAAHRFFAVGHDGTRIEVPVTLAGTTPTPPTFTIGTGQRVYYLVPALGTTDNWTLELTSTWSAENHIGTWGSPLLASDEDPGKDGNDQRFQYWWNAPGNKAGVISFKNNTASFPRPAALPVTFAFTLECEGDGDIYITLKVNGETVDSRRRISGMTALSHVSKNTNYPTQGTLTRR
ncbi:MAG: M60 family metallopeptidase [Odoribacteraceae bacterium]|jgi:hypothetical protein|nr:M60 family metallopeptidase [Odoribacteraceae bacterium]